jgi:transposase
VTAYHILARNEPFTDLGADFFVVHHDPEPTKLVRQLKALGFKVNIQPVAAA